MIAAPLLPEAIFNLWFLPLNETSLTIFRMEGKHV
jgi:hypothetical protein